MKVKTRTRYTLFGSDFSSQEVMILAQLSQDPAMLQIFAEGKNLYSAVAAMVYKNNYEDNTEFFPDGTMNPEGKHRRQSCKAIILGLMYGRGVKAIADQIKKDPKADTTKEDIEEAKRLVNVFYDSYPVAAAWFKETHRLAKENGFVEDIWGRRRRLPDITLPPYEFKLSKPRASIQFNPLLTDDKKDYSVDRQTQERFINLFKKCHDENERLEVERAALNEGIIAKDNTGLIAKAERQSINARIQGSAASMTKIAMGKIYRDPIMKELDCHMLIPVHDELICECPIENVEQAKARLSKLMIEAAKPECQIEMRCDADDFICWYEDVISAELKEAYEELVGNGISEEQALELVRQKNCEFSIERIKELIGE